MPIESPISYGDWYWKQSVDATGLRAKQIEDALSPIAASITNTFNDVTGIPPDVSEILNILSNPPDPTWDESLIGYIGAALSRVTDLVFKDKLRDMDYGINVKLQNLALTPEAANTLFSRRLVPENFWLSRLNYAGYSKDEGALYYESQKPYPSIDDIIRFARYTSDPLNPKTVTEQIYDISDREWPVWEFLARQKLTTEQVQQLLVRQVVSTADIEGEFARLGWVNPDIYMLKTLAYQVPNAMLMVQGGLIQGKTYTDLLDDVSIADIHPMYAKTYLDAVLTKPSTGDIVAYALRRDPMLSNLDTQLQRVGIHSDYFDVYKELAYQIPPVADIITMAVREAFTPSIAARFGQYEDLPEDYVQWVQKKGLTREWAERYWAAHWSLPSLTQGFEMLHRGIIGIDDIHLLLRASDVMPYWRDKLIQIAYQPLTRVDVRRMFALGVLNRAGVKRAYLDLGYNDYNAELMTRFTEAYTEGKPKRLSVSEITNAYKKYQTDEGTARGLLRDIGTPENEINLIIRDANFKREWEYKDERVAAISNLYRKGKLSEGQTRAELSKLDLPSNYVQTLIEQWTAKSEAEKETLWTTAQTLSFLKNKLITKERAIQEFTALGYDDEHVTIYVRSVSAA